MAATPRIPSDPQVFRSACLAGISEVWNYENGVRTEKTGEFSYDVALPAVSYAHVSIKIRSAQPLLPLDEVIAPDTKVVFENLIVTPYVRNNTLNYSGSASSIRFDKANTPIPTAKS